MSSIIGRARGISRGLDVGSDDVARVGDDVTTVGDDGTLRGRRRCADAADDGGDDVTPGVRNVYSAPGVCTCWCLRFTDASSCAATMTLLSKNVAL